MKTKLMKILIFIITIILLFGNIPALAVINTKDYAPSMIGGGDLFKNKVNFVLGIINLIGTICSVVIIVMVGIKYMLGSVDEKAEYKKTMLNYMIGAFLLFSSTTLPNILYKFATGN